MILYHVNFSSELETNAHSRPHTRGVAFGSNLGFSIFDMRTGASRGSIGRSVDDALYLRATAENMLKWTASSVETPRPADLSANIVTWEISTNAK